MKDYDRPMAATDDTGVGADSTHTETTSEDLQAASEDELDAVYRDATTPEVEDLEGRYHGSVVSGRVFPLDTEAALRVVNTEWMPWGGKKFYPVDEDESRGCNWYRLGPVERNGYSFVGRVTPAIYGRSEAYVLDYDLPDNPGAVQNVRDELKKVRDGLYLGRTYLRMRGEHRFVMYFVLEE